MLTFKVVAEPLRGLGNSDQDTEPRTAALLNLRNIPKRSWSRSQTTFSCGAQQRTNIARCFSHTYPTLLLDEPALGLFCLNRSSSML
ncbi:MAG: ATP-binding cassette domain-containing protein [Roseobacter sp.]